jgi:hypothetical protein
MVVGPRRNRSAYSINLRCYGKTAKDRYISRHILQILPALINVANQGGADEDFFEEAAIALLLIYVNINGVVELHNPVFQRTNLRTGHFDAYELYQMRITDPGHIPILLAILRIPVTITLNNGGKCNGEEALLLLLYMSSFPTRQNTVQKLFGREYSQISRICTAMYRYIDQTWKHLVTDNLAFFAGRFPAYNAAIRAKHLEKNGVEIPLRWRDTAVFLDGTKLNINKSYPDNYSGYKKRNCL